MSKPKAGDWVLVWGQLHPRSTHPEDVSIEFSSHSEQYLADVRVDWVELADHLPEFARTCTALFQFAGGDNGLFVRCERHEGHGKKHRDTAGNKYAESQVVGYMEES